MPTWTSHRIVPTPTSHDSKSWIAYFKMRPHWEDQFWRKIGPKAGNKVGFQSWRASKQKRMIFSCSSMSLISCMEPGPLWFTNLVLILYTTRILIPTIANNIVSVTNVLRKALKNLKHNFFTSNKIMSFWFRQRCLFAIHDFFFLCFISKKCRWKLRTYIL